MSTPHNNANLGDIAKTVLMPGDPLRAKYIADNYLENVVCFNTVRNMFGYTGTYKGKKVSIMGSGMGMPSIGIYSYELYKFYDVDNIIRIGSAGSYKNDVKIYDVVVADKAYSESNYAHVFNLYESDVMKPSEFLNDKIKKVAAKKNIDIKTGCIHSSDVFYHEKGSNYMDGVIKNDCICVEMESFALFSNAFALKKNAACILTISDSLVTHQETTAAERQNSFNKMMELALETTLEL
ncbi:purine-nucleoside phosphorylase [bacterium]|nr:purine-nucleoside phosphorylase [bacterium]